jgi:predicted dehydrogenase
MNTKKINVAMVGLGFGAEFIPIYQSHPNANVIAICRRNPADLNVVGDRFGIANRYQEFEKVLEDPEVDFVHINSPIPDHAWMSMRALKAGKHVMCAPFQWRPPLPSAIRFANWFPIPGSST